MPEESLKRYTVRGCHGFFSDLPWDTAEVLSDFTFPWEPDREIPRTEFRALWDDELFYFRFDCDDRDIVLGDGADAMEKVIGSDRAEIFFAPDLDLQPYFCLEMDPRGEVLDYEARFHRQINWDWQCPGLKVDASRNETGYQVKGSVPMETLRQLQVLKPGAEKFLAGVFRAEFSHAPDDAVDEGWMAWIDPKTTEADFHIPDTFGVLDLAD